jgi:hypothetical protein
MADADNYHDIDGENDGGDRHHGGDGGMIFLWILC